MPARALLHHTHTVDHGDHAELENKNAREGTVTPGSSRARRRRWGLENKNAREGTVTLIDGADPIRNAAELENKNAREGTVTNYRLLTTCLYQMLENKNAREGTVTYHHQLCLDWQLRLENKNAREGTVTD